MTTTKCEQGADSSVLPVGYHCTTERVSCIDRICYLTQPVTLAIKRYGLSQTSASESDPFSYII